MTKYTILSIGPITDAMSMADNTRALWTASYMFSYIMQTTITNVRETINSEETIKDCFIVPTSKFDYLTSGNRAGLFHDRLILKGDYAKVLNDAYHAAVNTFADVVVEAFDEAEPYKYVSLSFKAKEIRNFIHSYFQCYVAMVELNDDDNPIIELSKYVEAVEYEPRLARHEDREYLFYFFRVANLALTKYFAFLKENAADGGKDRCFKSLPEISAWELTENWDKRDEYFCLTVEEMNERNEKIKDIESSDEEIFKVLKGDFKKLLKPYHKYVAIVQADGDGFGKYLESLKGDIEKVQKFSDDIFEFSDSARATIEKEGGAVVYAGGDDLLFFAPVVNKEENIFTLINKIDNEFKKIFGDDTGLSLSYGISISYYKFPMQEALDIASDSLWTHAKKSIWVNKDENINNLNDDNVKDLLAKNALHINIQKHSGQSHSLTLPKNTKLYTDFITLLMSELNSYDKLHLPHSLHHALESAEEIITQIDSGGVKNFFKNQFNEDVHETTHKTSLDSVRDILIHLKDSGESHHLLTKDKENKFVKANSEVDILFSMLSTIKLLRGDA